MGIFQYESGKLMPAQLGKALDNSLEEGVMRSIRVQILEVIARPLFPVSWIKTSLDDSVTARVHSLVALDPSGQIVTVEIINELNAQTLVGALSRLGVASASSWNQLANSYPGGSDAFHLALREFKESCSPCTKPGARLVLVIGAIDPEIFGALDALRESGLELHQVKLRELSGGRKILEVLDIDQPFLPKQTRYAGQYSSVKQAITQNILSRADENSGFKHNLDSTDPSFNLDDNAQIITEENLGIPKPAVLSYATPVPPVLPQNIQIGVTSETLSSQVKKESAEDSTGVESAAISKSDVQTRLSDARDEMKCKETTVKRSVYEPRAKSRIERQRQMRVAGGSMGGASDPIGFKRDSGQRVEIGKPISHKHPVKGVGPSPKSMMSMYADAEKEYSDSLSATSKATTKPAPTIQSLEKVVPPVAVAMNASEHRLKPLDTSIPISSTPPEETDLAPSRTDESAVVQFKPAWQAPRKRRGQYSVEASQRVSRREERFVGKNQAGLKAVAKELGQDTVLLWKDWQGRVCEIVLRPNGLLDSGDGVMLNDLQDAFERNGGNRGLDAWEMLRIGTPAGSTLAEALADINHEMAKNR